MAELSFAVGVLVLATLVGVASGEGTGVAVGDVVGVGVAVNAFCETADFAPANERNKAQKTSAEVRFAIFIKS